MPRTIKKTVSKKPAPKKSARVGFAKSKPRAATAKRKPSVPAHPRAKQRAAPQAVVPKALVPKNAIPKAVIPKAVIKTGAKASRAESGGRAAPSAGKKIFDAVAAALVDAKALDIVTLDVRKLTDIADCMMIASGTSSRHVSSVADKVVDKLRGLGRKPIGIEGKDSGEWVLIDFGDVVVHVMRPQTRDFYNLEKLWAQDMAADKDAPSELELHIRARHNR